MLLVWKTGGVATQGRILFLCLVCYLLLRTLKSPSWMYNPWDFNVTSLAPRLRSGLQSCLPSVTSLLKSYRSRDMEMKEIRNGHITTTPLTCFISQWLWFVFDRTHNPMNEELVPTIYEEKKKTWRFKCKFWIINTKALFSFPTLVIPHSKFFFIYLINIPRYSIKQRDSSQYMHKFSIYHVLICK